MSKEVSLIDYDKETEAISKYEHYSVGFHNTFGDIRSLHVRLTPLETEATDTDQPEEEPETEPVTEEQELDQAA